MSERIISNSPESRRSFIRKSLVAVGLGATVSGILDNMWQNTEFQQEVAKQIPEPTDDSVIAATQDISAEKSADLSEPINVRTVFRDERVIQAHRNAEAARVRAFHLKQEKNAFTLRTITENIGICGGQLTAIIGAFYIPDARNSSLPKRDKLNQ